MKSYTIDSRNNQSPKCEQVHETKLNLKIRLLPHAWSAQLHKHQLHRKLYFLLKHFKTSGCQLCTNMSDLWYLQKTRLNLHVVDSDFSSIYDELTRKIL